ncbi:MAG TPA: hypothetical protein VE954_32500 [Oligoflexus sp.]|uniref:hypothetical protein n=1 Tax=Oligoflexus sp. TaxID=1971216 RepID=UPI002D3C0C17|nr:hypothetical protein [Oligoflexus sp.]HYX37849.1 hypothetical protein [Oligoflexus sp.]
MPPKSRIAWLLMPTLIGCHEGSDKPSEQTPDQPTCTQNGLSPVAEPALTLMSGSETRIVYRLCADQKLYADIKDLPGAILEATLRGEGCEQAVLTQGLQAAFQAPFQPNLNCELQAQLSWNGTRFSHSLPFATGSRPSPTTQETLTVNFSSVPDQPEHFDLVLQSTAGARIFDPFHSDYALFQNVLKAANEQGFELSDRDSSFDINERRWLVKAPKPAGRQVLATHPFTSFFGSLKAQAREVDALKLSGKLDVEDFSMETDEDLPAILVESDRDVSGQELGAGLSAMGHCLLPLFDREDVPNHLLAPLNQLSHCSDTVAKQALGLWPSLRFTTSNLSLAEARVALPTSPRRHLAPISAFALDICQFHPEDTLKVANFQAVGWVPASTTPAEARRHCRAHYMRNIFQHVTSRIEAGLLNYHSTQYPNTPLLRLLMESISVPASFDAASLFKQTVLRELIDPDIQDLEFFNPRQGYNPTEASAALLNTHGSWDRAMELYVALFKGTALAVFAAQKDEATRLRLHEKLGRLYLNDCNKAQPITISCVNSSATGISLYTIKGIGTSSAIGFAHLRRGG